MSLVFALIQNTSVNCNSPLHRFDRQSNRGDNANAKAGFVLVRFRGTAKQLGEEGLSA
jgi:hypothetical protein